jgi:heme exporter protein C
MINNIKLNKIIDLLDRFIIYFSIITLLTIAVGLYYSLFSSPADYQQGEMVRIMYIHVPSAWMSLMIYSFMTISSILYVFLRNPLYNIISYSASTIGICFTIVTLITGSLWGKPIWGTWWVWDARLTSVLILLFFYIGYISLFNSIRIIDYNSISPAILNIVGFINIPIVKFSVDFWNSLHQPASIMRFKSPAIHSSMLKPLMIMFLGSIFYFFTMLIIKVKTELIEKKINRINYIN